MTRQYGEGSISKRADGRYYCRLFYTDDTGRKRMKDLYGKTRKEVVTKRREAQRLIEDHQPLRQSSMTVSAWTRIWLDTMLKASSRKATTNETYDGYARAHLLEGTLADVRLDQLGPSHVEAWLAGMTAHRMKTDGKPAAVSSSTKRQALIVLRLVLDAAMREELIRRNVARIVDRPRVERQDALHYDSDEIRRLIEASKDHRLGDFLIVAAYTGMRKGELLGLRWQDVDMTAGSIRVTGTLARVGGKLTRVDPKTDKGRRTVPLTDEAVAALRSTKRRQARERLAAGEAWTDSGLVFTTEAGTPVDPRNALRWFKIVCSTAGVRVGKIHEMRHAAASVLLANGVPMPIVSDIMGHSSITVTVDMYGHMSPSQVAEQMRRGMAGYGSA
jgi:integrase